MHDHFDQGEHKAIINTTFKDHEGISAVINGLGNFHSLNPQSRPTEQLQRVCSFLLIPMAAILITRTVHSLFDTSLSQIENVFSESVVSENVFSKSVFSKSVFSESVFSKSVFS